MKQTIKNFISYFIKTRSMPVAFSQVIGVTVLYALFGLIILAPDGALEELWKTLLEHQPPQPKLLELLNASLKFAMWLFLAYGTIQAYGRQIEFNFINKQADKADNKLDDAVSKVETDAEKKNAEKEHATAYEKQFESLDLIRDDNKTGWFFYILAIILFAVTSILDIYLLQY